MKLKRIKFDGTGDGVNDSGVHFVHWNMDYTLCGVTLDGDPLTAGEFSYTNKKVNCKNCIQLIRICKSIKSTEYKSVGS